MDFSIIAFKNVTLSLTDKVTIFFNSLKLPKLQHWCLLVYWLELSYGVLSPPQQENKHEERLSHSLSLRCDPFYHSWPLNNLSEEKEPRDCMCVYVSESIHVSGPVRLEPLGFRHKIIQSFHHGKRKCHHVMLMTSRRSCQQLIHWISAPKNTNMAEDKRI